MPDIIAAVVETSTEDGWIQFQGAPNAIDKINTYLSVFCSSSSETTLHRAFGFFDLSSIPSNAVVVTDPVLLVNVLASTVGVGASQSIYVAVGGAIGPTLETSDYGVVQANSIQTLVGSYFNTTGDKSIGLIRETLRRGFGGILNVEIRANPESGTSTIQLQSQENVGSSPMRLSFSYYVPTVPVAHWKCDDSSLATMIDATANARNLTTVGSPPIVPGRLLNARDFQGNDLALASYATGVSDVAFKATLIGVWTFTAWLKITPKTFPLNGNTAMRHVVQSGSWSQPSQNELFLLSLFTAGTKGLQFGHQVGVGGLYVFANFTSWNTPVNQLFHLAITKSIQPGGLCTFSAYLNAALVQAISGLLNTSDGSAVNVFNVAGLPAASGAGFLGLMDDIRLYASTLSVAQISIIMADDQSTRRGATSSPVSNRLTIGAVANKNLGAMVSNQETNAVVSNTSTDSPVSNRDTGAVVSNPNTDAVVTNQRVGATVSSPSADAVVTNGETNAVVSNPSTDSVVSNPKTKA